MPNEASFRTGRVLYVVKGVLRPVSRLLEVCGESQGRTLRGGTIYWALLAARNRLRTLWYFG